MTHPNHRNLLFTSALLALLATSPVSAETAASAPAGAVRSISDETSAILSGLPADTSKAAHERAAQLVSRGKKAILEVCSQIVAPGQGEDTAARYLLETLSWHVARPGAENERKLYTEALAEALSSAQDPQVKVFFLEHLGRIGKKDAVQVITPYLSDKEIGDAATRALLLTQAVNTGEAVRKALPGTEGRTQLALVHALGDLRAKEAAADLVPLAQSDNPDLRRAALYALANMGAPEALENLTKAAAQTTVPLELGRLDSWKLLYAQRIAEAGDKQKAAEIARALMAERSSLDRDAFQIRGLGTLAAILNEGAQDDLLKAMASPSKEVRAAALSFAQKIKGANVTQQWVDQLSKVAPQVQGEILGMLAERGDKAALPAVVAALKSPEADVRVAAIGAAAQLGGKAVLPDLLAVLTSDQKPEIEAVKRVLQQWPGDDVLKGAADSLANASNPGKVALLELLAARGAVQHKESVFARAEDQARPVRVAAFKALDTLAAGEDLPRLVKLLLAADSNNERQAAQVAVAATAKRMDNEGQRLQPLLAAYDGASVENKESILATLAKLGGAQALEVVSRETSSTQAEIQTAAVRSLGDWSGEEAMPRLLEIARTAPEENHHVLATRGYIRLLDASKMPGEEKLPLFHGILKDARRADEKRQALGSLADIRTTDSLKLAAQYLNDEALRNDAALAAAKIAVPKGGRDKGLRGAEIAAILLKVIPHLQDEDLKKKTEEHVNAINLEIESNRPSADAEGFAPLFDGTTLVGWAGSVDGYYVEDGAIVCDPKKGGNLYTARQYDDFVLRFEFKLTPGANNGLGIRAPLEGDAAFQAMELQILDDTSPKYKDLKDWQIHGSIYGVLPAKAGHLKPVGEWNEQEVTAKGGQITVKLNGTTIVDGNVFDIPTTGTLDGRPHPGLHRRQGHIGFLGHGSRVDFRNIRLKELINEPPQGFTALFNGKDLTGWKGLVENPIKRAKMSPEELAAAQEKADQEMRDHWKVVNGTLVFDGKGSHLCTTKNYADFEMLVDWKMGPGGDSGIYLRGTPQVQIWDPAHWNIGSGGLYNNKENTSMPLVLADRPLGEWNTFRIKMQGEKVTVHLNDQLVVDNVTLENYWDRKQPIFPSEQIELQNHGAPYFFRNIFIRELAAK